MLTEQINKRKTSEKAGVENLRTVSQRLGIEDILNPYKKII